MIWLYGFSDDIRPSLGVSRMPTLLFAIEWVDFSPLAISLLISGPNSYQVLRFACFSNCLAVLIDSYSDGVGLMINFSWMLPFKPPMHLAIHWSWVFCRLLCDTRPWKSWVYFATEWPPCRQLWYCINSCRAWFDGRNLVRNNFFIFSHVFIVFRRILGSIQLDLIPPCRCTTLQMKCDKFHLPTLPNVRPEALNFT